MKRKRGPGRRKGQRLLLAAARVLLAISAAQASAQSLDEAVRAQLDNGPGGGGSGGGCALLLAGDPITVLNEGLRSVCDIGNQGQAVAGGGGAGTAVSMPEAVRQRVEDEGVEDQPTLRGVFATVSTGVDDREATRFQDGYQGDVTGLLGGFDRELGAWVAGFTVGYWRHEGNFAGGGDFETTTVGPTGFASRPLTDRAELVVYGGYNSVSNDRARVATYTPVEQVPALITGRLSADFDATELLAGAQLAFNLTRDNVTLRPTFALDWQQTDFDSYAETEPPLSTGLTAPDDSGLALVFYDDQRTSLMSTIGVDASVSIGMEFGVIVASGHMHYKHEHDDKQRTVSVSFVDDTRNKRFQYQTEPPDTDHLEFGLDAVFVLSGGLQVLAAYERITSHQYLDTSLFSAGFRKEF